MAIIEEFISKKPSLYNHLQPPKYFGHLNEMIFNTIRQKRLTSQEFYGLVDTAYLATSGQLCLPATRTNLISAINGTIPLGIKRFKISILSTLRWSGY